MNYTSVMKTEEKERREMKRKEKEGRQAGGRWQVGAPDRGPLGAGRAQECRGAGKRG